MYWHGCAGVPALSGAGEHSMALEECQELLGLWGLSGDALLQDSFLSSSV